MSVPAIFIDRDGTLIVERNYLSDPSLVELERSAIAGMNRLANLQVPLIVVTNQSGIGRGYFAIADAEAVNLRVAELFRRAGIEFSRWYICPHGPDSSCDCRKPRTGMVLAAKADLDVDLARSVVIGDNKSDVELGVRMGGRGILVLTGHGAKHQSWAQENGHSVCADLAAAAELVASWLGHDA